VAWYGFAEVSSEVDEQARGRIIEVDMAPPSGDDDEVAVAASSSGSGGVRS